MTDTNHRGPRGEHPPSIDTSRLPADGGEHYNRLIFENSPYLLQHATNPVDWYPWGEEAFEKARQRDLPVLVSIGYASCHWCHVMEQESFTDPAVAQVLNDFFVPVKVDREERPDIDNLYMTACHLATGGGGWPLNVFLTPDKIPFFATTYLPRQRRGDTPDILAVLNNLADMWRSRRDDILATGRQLGETLIQMEQKETPAAETLDRAPLQAAFMIFRQAFDHQRGGFGEAPKFPMPHNLSLLLRIAERFEEPDALAMATRTLQHMRLGGLYDHIGFGIHRYAVDAHWRVPHFEKMLYDQALLTLASLDAFQSTGDRFFAQLADQTMTYVLRALTLPEGAFCSGEDADTDGVEGAFYLWTPQQVIDVLGHQHATIFCNCYEIREEGNFEGSNIPRLEMDLGEWAQWFGTTSEELGGILEDGRRKLFEARARRTQPARDDKVLTAWNGLTIAALAQTGSLLAHPEYIPAAQKAADFVLKHLRSPEGRLLRRWRKGKAGIPAFLEDYAGLVLGLIALYQASFIPRYLAEAVTLTRQMRDLFGSEKGIYYDTGTDAEEVLVRKRTLHDGAMPTGNSMAALAMLRLATLTADDELADHAGDILKASATQWQKAPNASSMLLMALDLALAPKQTLVIAAPRHDPTGQAFVEAARSAFRPELSILWQIPEDRELAQLTPLARDKRPLDGQATAYLCRNKTCQEPARAIDQLRQQLQNRA